MCTPGKAPARILFENELDRVLVLPYANDLVMPTYFPAVSGTGTNWNPIDLIRLLIARGPTSKQLLESVRSIIANSPTPLRAIAIPERECGPNLLERTGTVAKVRSLLDSVSKGTILHVLGCGFPLTAGVYTYAGA